MLCYTPTQSQFQRRHHLHTALHDDLSITIIPHLSPSQPFQHHLHKQHQVAVFGEKHPPVVVETGESIMYLGSNYAIIKDDVDSVEISENEQLVPENFDVAALTAWLKVNRKLMEII